MKASERISVAGDAIRGSGYERDAGPVYAPQGVRWWLFYADESGFVFARGGRVRTARIARRTISATVGLCIAEKIAYDCRPSHVLERDGSLTEIAR